MNTILPLFSSRLGETLLFFAMIGFTVVSLEVYGTRLARSMPSANARVAAIVLAIAFVSMAVGGVSDYIVAGHLGFINLALFLTGAAGAGILFDIVWRSQHGDPDELRHVIAEDL